MLCERAMKILRIPRRLGEACVEIRHEFLRVGVGRLYRVDVTQPQFIYQAILKRLIGALHAAC
jgi:hypothetical protein